MKKGVFAAVKKDGSVYYRASITFRCKHISLGSFTSESEAHGAYQSADKLLSATVPITPEDYQETQFPLLPFSKWISLLNFKNNGIYIKTPIYLRKKYFQYYLSSEETLLFDVDDLFFYSNHAIMKRGGHLFVAEYGMQTNIRSRYGIRAYASKDIDFTFVNGNENDYRYSNLNVLNPYHGVTIVHDKGHTEYIAKLHLNGNYLIGRFPSLIEAAIAYNKAVDLACMHGCTKQFPQNYIDSLSSKEYLAYYKKITLPDRLLSYRFS